MSFLKPGGETEGGRTYREAVFKSGTYKPPPFSILLLNGFQGHFFVHHLSLELEKQGLLGSDKEKVIFELTEISEHQPSGSSWLPWLVWQATGNY